jgi:hypothetical protein
MKYSGIQESTQKHSPMKNKVIILMIFAALSSQCTTPKYLPSSDKIDINTYGSYIYIHHKFGANVKGELISVDSSKLVVLTKNRAVTVPISEISSFTLKFARSKNYGYTVPLYTLATVSHGLFLIFSAPVNLIVTFLVSVRSQRAFSYSQREISYDKLKMFARFPQGLPPDIDMTKIY